MNQKVLVPHKPTNVARNTRRKMGEFGVTLLGKSSIAGLDCIQTFQVDLVRSCTDDSDGSRPQPSIGAAVQGPAIPADKALLE